MTQPKRILLVEDNAQDLELTLEALEDFNLATNLIVARDGVEALDCLYGRGKFTGLPTELPTVVLLDLKLPKIDGLDVLRRMKSDPQLKHIAVVMLTSSREEKDLLESYRLGVNAYVIKPVRFDDFVQTIKSLGVFWLVVNEPPPRLPVAV